MSNDHLENETLETPEAAEGVDGVEEPAEEPEGEGGEKLEPGEAEELRAELAREQIERARREAFTQGVRVGASQSRQKPGAATAAEAARPTKPRRSTGSTGSGGAGPMIVGVAAIALLLVTIGIVLWRTSRVERRTVEIGEELAGKIEEV